MLKKWYSNMLEMIDCHRCVSCLYVCSSLWIVQFAFEGKSTQTLQAKHQHRPKKSWVESTQLYQWHLLLAHKMNVLTLLIPIVI